MKNSEFNRGVQAAAEVAREYNRSCSHPKDLGDCILLKLNQTNRRPRPNTRFKLIKGMPIAQISYIISEARTATLKDIEKSHRGSSGNTFKDAEINCVEWTFKILRRRLNLRGRVKRK